MSKRLLFAAGGTGGHLFPAETLAKALLEKIPTLDIHFAAHGLSTNKRFKQEFPFTDIQAASIKKNPLTWCTTAYALTSGLFQAIKLLRAKKPDLVVGFGSYHTAPITAAAALLGVPFVLFESNSTPGQVIRHFSKRARWTGIYFPECEERLQGNLRLVHMPLRHTFKREKQPTREEAARYYGLDPTKKTVLIFGGSQGARRINELMFQAYPLVTTENLQYLHFTGSADLHSPYAHGVVKPFEERMEMAYALGDLVISRSGAATIAELQAFDLPAIFIPYPNAADNHQEKNGRFVENVLRRALVIREADCTGERLAHAIDNYFSKGLSRPQTPYLQRLDLREQILMELNL